MFEEDVKSSLSPHAVTNNKSIHPCVFLETSPLPLRSLLEFPMISMQSSSMLSALHSKMTLIPNRLGDPAEFAKTSLTYLRFHDYCKNPINHLHAIYLTGYTLTLIAVLIIDTQDTRC